MTVRVAGYDDDGNATVFELEPGGQLPPGVHPKPPPGTHPHERELAAQAARTFIVDDPAKREQYKAELEKVNHGQHPTRSDRRGAR